MLEFLLTIFALMNIFHLYRIVKGPSIWDRLLGFNLFSVTIILLLVIYAVIKDINYLLDIAIVYALLGFIGVVFIARFIQGRGKI